MKTLPIVIASITALALLSACGREDEEKSAKAKARIEKLEARAEKAEKRVEELEKKLAAERRQDKKDDKKAPAKK
jgi:nitroimidazol reductase NimA-like FMN-containing flavoprotein (pyridoxamine 5'-phosphate oxidase superfamily)